MRLRSTESLLLRIWRCCVLSCRQFWPIRPSSYSSSRLCRPSLLSSWRSTNHHHLHRSDLQGSTLTLHVLILPVGTLTILFGGVGCSGTLFVFLCFVYYCFSLSSMLFSLFIYSAYWSCFVFSIACSGRWCLGLILVHFASHLHVDESCVVVCVCLGHSCM